MIIVEKTKAAMIVSVTRVVGVEGPGLALWALEDSLAAQLRAGAQI